MGSGEKNQDDDWWRYVCQRLSCQVSRSFEVGSWLIGSQAVKDKKMRGSWKKETISATLVSDEGSTTKKLKARAKQKSMVKQSLKENEVSSEQSNIVNSLSLKFA